MRFRLSDLIDPRLLPLVAETRSLYAARPAGQGRRDWAELCAVRARTATLVSVDPPAEVLIRLDDRQVALRIHRPPSGPIQGVFMEIHGGGFYMGSAAGSDIRNREISRSLGMAVVSVDYRLAPELPWPAAPDDCEAAALWLIDNAKERFGTENFAISGSPRAQRW